MAIDIKAALSKPANAAKFTDSFISGYMSPAFGARSKTEIDLLVFASLIEAGAIDQTTPEYDIARALNITPTRVRNLILNWQLRSTPAQSDLHDAIVEALKQTRFSNDGKLLTFGIESPLLKEEITARLKRKGVFPDASFSKELVKLPADAFVEFLDEIVDNQTKTQVMATLVKDKQIADTGFKALATGLLVALGKKAAGDAGGALAEKLTKPAAEKATNFIIGLLTGNAKGAAEGLDKDDIIVV